MRVIQVVPSIAAESSGPSYSVPGLCGGLKAVGVDVELHVPSAVPHEAYPFTIVSYPCKSFFRMRGSEWSPALRKGLFGECRRSDIVQTNALWMIPCVYAAQAVKGTTCKLVTAPRGSLAAWAMGRSRMKKRIVGSVIGQYSAMAATDLWHATCEKEYEEIRAAGYRQPVAIVPIGMDLPSVRTTANPQDDGKRTVAFFGRIHKVKAVDNLVLAWEKVSARHPNWELVVAGPDGGMVATLNTIIAERKIARVRFVGEINGAAKYEFLSSIDLYVLTSHTENFGVTVAEALACGTPVIVSKNTPWGGVVANRCGWFVANDVETLAATIDEAMDVQCKTLREMGARGREWIRRDFSWEGIGREMLSAYEWLCHGSERPKCVRVE